MSIFNNKEDARIEKQSGDVIGPYKALFAGSTIIIDDPKANVEGRRGSGLVFCVNQKQ